MATTLFFSATMQKSSKSLVARAMELNSLNRVVYFVLRGRVLRQRGPQGELLLNPKFNELADLLSHTLVMRVPLHNGHREMFICRAATLPSDRVHIDNYRAVLEHVFGPNCRTSIRVCWKEEIE